MRGVNIGRCMPDRSPVSEFMGSLSRPTVAPMRDEVGGLAHGCTRRYKHHAGTSDCLSQNKQKLEMGRV